ncbi:MAG: hypothetical protein ACTHU0_29080 [Kofleriaceae bacterium]
MASAEVREQRRVAEVRDLAGPARLRALEARHDPRGLCNPGLLA